MKPETLIKRFAEMGARAQVSEFEAVRRTRSRETRNPNPVVLDVRRDDKGEFFSVQVREGVELEVLDVKPKNRHLLLMARDEQEVDLTKQKSKYLCGHDERAWFVAAIPEKAKAKNVKEAKEALRPTEVVKALEKADLHPHEQDRRRNKAFIRQGEWFFVPRPNLTVPNNLVIKNEPIRRGRAKPHMCDEMYRIGGTTVYFHARYAPNGESKGRMEEIIGKDSVKRIGWKQMVRDAKVYVRGNVRHSDHKTILLKGWHEVVPNTETEAKAMQHVAFLD